MDVVALCEDFERRGIAIIADHAKLLVGPASRLTEADHCAIRACKPDLLRLVHDRETRIAKSAEAYAALFKALGRIEHLVSNAAIPMRRQVGEMLASFGARVESLFERRDFNAIHYELADCEKCIVEVVALPLQ
jgi:hypothetical protein